MNQFQGSQSRLKQSYDKENLKRAYAACVSNGMSVYRASRVYNVPESTLRDRTRHNVTLEARPGPETLLSTLEEDKLAQHIKYMASIGYGYTMTNIQFMAADYARSMGKKVLAKEGLSTVWYYSFMKRNTDLKTVKPQKLDLARAKGASKQNIDNYFKELKKILDDNHLYNSPERIYNIDETGVSTQHSPPKIICGKSDKPQAITSPRSSNVTIIGGANALGNHVPPFYIFPGKRFNVQFMKGAQPGADGTMSDSGWVNGEIFEYYVKKHLAKHCYIDSVSSDRPATLIMYDGHKSHLSLTLNEWARQRNVILFVLPPHTSHLTQPLDVGVYGPFKSFYYSECQRYLQSNPGVHITKYEIASLTSKPYLKAFSPSNIISAFKKSGVFPFDESCISKNDTAPSTIYCNENVEQCQLLDKQVEVTETTPQLSKETSDSQETILYDESVSFFAKRQINIVKQRPRKKFIPPYIMGNLLNDKNTNILKNQGKSKSASSEKTVEKRLKKPIQTQSKKQKMATGHEEPVPGTSGTSNTGGAICLDSSPPMSDSETDIEIEEGDKCCVCNLYTPTELKDCISIVFTKWAQCNFCPHWVHLKFCSPITVVRRATVFRCPHCATEE